MDLKNIFLVARNEYIKWLMNPRMVMMLAVCIPIRELVILPMRKAAEEMNQPINILEPCIAVANSGLILLLLPLAYIVLMSSFPTVDGNMLFYIVRMGRRNWIIGEIVFQMLGAVTYCVVIVGIVMLQTAGISFWADGWSITVTDYDKIHADAGSVRMSAILPPNLHAQLPPVKAFLLSYTLLLLFLLFCSMLFLLGCVYSKSLFFYFCVILQTVAGSCLCVLGQNAMWFFPVCHSILKTHYQNYFRKYVFPPGQSIGLFLILLTVLGILSFRRVKEVNLDMIGGLS